MKGARTAPAPGAASTGAPVQRHEVKRSSSYWMRLCGLHLQPPNQQHPHVTLAHTGP